MIKGELVLLKIKILIIVASFLKGKKEITRAKLGSKSLRDTFKTVEIGLNFII